MSVTFRRAVLVAAGVLMIATSALSVTHAAPIVPATCGESDAPDCTEPTPDKTRVIVPAPAAPPLLTPALPPPPAKPGSPAAALTPPAPVPHPGPPIVPAAE
ncbi:hypothetical protein [Nocardia pseudovaccinii]|uniref:hypothetical protein n=1 Tax=Nocardia pseudovaccinii TaxID=189540 RepID=UPI000ADAD018|nr:hypothetical protein [Nocardia pseudovaccinii]